MGPRAPWFSPPTGATRNRSPLSGRRSPDCFRAQAYTTRGFSANYSYRLSGNADLSFLALRSYTTYDSAIVPGSTTYNVLRALATLRISPRSTLFAGVRYQWQDATTSSYSEYREAGLFGGWDYSFR